MPCENHALASVLGEGGVNFRPPGVRKASPIVTQISYTIFCSNVFSQEIHKQSKEKRAQSKQQFPINFSAPYVFLKKYTTKTKKNEPNRNTKRGLGTHALFGVGHVLRIGCLAKIILSLGFWGRGEKISDPPGCEKQAQPTHKFPIHFSAPMFSSRNTQAKQRKTIPIETTISYTLFGPLCFP